jgi:hypothetical protein
MAPRTVISNAALKGNKKPYPHRFHLVDGRVIDGHLFREPNSRLADDLYGMKGGFISVLGARCTTTGREMPYVALNVDHIVSIEEL